MAKLDTYESVTNAIIARLESGVKPWAPRWITGGAGGGMVMPRRHNGECYRGINVLLLWATAEDRGYRAPTWMTFKQALELGGAVRKGEKGTMIVFFKKLKITEQNEAGEDQDKQIPMLRTYFVFNVEQIDGLPAKYYPAEVELVGGKDRDEAAEAALRSCGANILERGDKAFYVPSQDYVNMPSFDRFHTASGYLATLAHELVHWTGAKHRLDRDQKGAFGSKDYAAEELVAEIGAAFIGARLGFVGEHIDNHASYLASWLKALKNDKRAIFRAATMAQAAADMVLANADLAAPVATAEPVQDVAQPAQLAMAL
ncbi:MAG: hypothetical protein B7Y36_08295 [Novosphingobium sp. 28-62-57]|nr:zincin-like metallopeptidase domain-containing protein [Novosphingobium sp. 28-62-57]OYW48036.1 MAG: hypothetical protein B7Z36_01385 [Novosphingobium sp. 12-63-9]OYZ10816.1 MAG: hypothetical protein B7Y36_08295 [Novosphingobium sp. 28-62-57]